ncbi:MAG: hypothetical protein GF401_20325 [Chitinivibrionales bacterium]|nr:hypothetical protein [Chitinivibrionales bacterium]
MAKKIGELIEIKPVQTVIRLEQGHTEPESIVSTFVVTGEVAAHLTVFSNSLQNTTGQGYFLQGDFGSGKSHFLAMLTAWLGRKEGGEKLDSLHPDMKALKSGGRKFLVAGASLVNFRSTSSLESICIDAVRGAFAEEGIPRPPSPFSAFIRFLDDILSHSGLRDTFVTECKSGADLGDWFADDPYTAYSRSVGFLNRHNIPLPADLVAERRETFKGIIEHAQQAGFDGCVLIIDELSEFFRSKPDTSSLNEDARTLQLLGELSRTRPLWIVAAVQESIEQTGDIASATFRKIKDRFPVKLQLSTVHIRDLISRRLIRKKPGAEKHIYEIYRRYRQHFPDFKCDYDYFQSIYPVHPTTLSLLEGLGELFSQHRGVVDFVHSQVAGDKGRNIEGILDRESTMLLAPDSIYTHFAHRIAEFSAFNIYPRHIVPHLDDVVENVIDEPEDRELAKRLIRSLILYTIHPAAEMPTVGTITELCSCMLASHDPETGVRFVSSALLDPIAEKSRFLAKKHGGSGSPHDAVYVITTKEDHTKTLRARLKRVMNEIRDDDSRLALNPLAGLPQSMSWPGPEILHDSARRIVTWRQSTRKAMVALLQKGNAPRIQRQFTTAFESGEADFGFVIAIDNSPFECPHTVVWRVNFSGPGREVLKEFLALRLLSAELKASNPADAPLIPMVKDSVRKLFPAVAAALIDCIYAGHFEGGNIMVDSAALGIKRFDRLLEASAAAACEERYPRYKEIAPKMMPPGMRHYQRLIDDFVVPGSISHREASTRNLIGTIESLAAPLGLADLKSGAYRLSPNPRDHPFLSSLFGMLKTAGPTPLNDVVRELMTGPFGVPKETIEFLLVALAHCGVLTLASRGRTVSLEYLNLSVLDKADAVAPGEIIGEPYRRTLLEECPFLAPSGGWGTFGLKQQREAWQAVIKFKASLETTLEQLYRHTAQTGDYAAFRKFDLHALTGKLDKMKSVYDEIKVSYAAREGLERFLSAWRRAQLSPEDFEKVKKMHRFFSRHAENFIFINHYLMHRSVETAVEADEQVAEARKGALAVVEQPELLVVPDEGVRLGEAFSLFRDIYTQYYQARHDAYYGSCTKPEISRYGKRALGVIRRLNDIKSLDRPAGLVDLLSALDRPDRPPCRRVIKEELLRNPSCSCGYQIGDRPPEMLTNNPEKEIERCVEEYRSILNAPAVKEALAARAWAIKDMNAPLAKRLSELHKALSQQTPVALPLLLDMLDEQTVTEIARALAGKVELKNRDLAGLVRSLAGRRLTPSKIRETIEQWIGTTDADTVIAVENMTAPQSDRSPAEWWPLIHPELVTTTPVEIGAAAARMLEQECERRFPSREMKSFFDNLDAAGLVRFIVSEPCHTRAIRGAWTRLASLVFSGDCDCSSVEIGSRHLLSHEAEAVKMRLQRLKRLSLSLGEGFPRRLLSRLHVSSIIADSRAPSELVAHGEKLIRDIEIGAADWCESLPEVPVINLDDCPVVLLVDALSPDVWLETAAGINRHIASAETAWYRLASPPQTIQSVNSLFGFDHDRDPIEEFNARSAEYHFLDGAESHTLLDMIPPMKNEFAVVIRIGMLDSAVHKKTMALHDMPDALGSMLASNLPPMIQMCKKEGRRLIITTDHGAGYKNRTLSHGKGGVFEETIIRVEWKPDKGDAG